MPNQKIDNQLNLSLELPEAERLKSSQLSTGYNPMTKTWELIVRYSGDLLALEEDVLRIEPLTNQYAILVVEEAKVNKIATYSQIEFVEKPHQLTPFLQVSKRAACITQTQEVYPNLTGRGVLLGVIDSGIDYRHPDFINPDGTTRIVSILQINDLTNLLTPTVEYTREQINLALQQPTEEEALQIVPSIDVIGHGTHVAGIAGGNGRASEGQYRGVAYESDFIIVQLGPSTYEPFTKSTELMRAVIYIINKAQSLNQPVAINISYGNNYGSHDGNSLFETYLDDMSNMWKNVIAVGSGNEGAAAHHYEDVLIQDEDKVIEFAVSPGETSVSVQLWKSYVDTISIEIESPSGEKSGLIRPLLGTQQFNLGQTSLALFFGEPSPYENDQEIYFVLLPNNEFISEGTWKIRIRPENIVLGNINLWLPVSSGLNIFTRFLQPSVNTTLTVPSTATKVITVGGYNQVTNSIASFSGRGYTREINIIKPNIVAPAVDVISTVPGGGYDALSGTSMAAPFVTGASAILMQWGIVLGNDPFLYGEKVKAYLQKSANRNESLRTYPNPEWGFGSLCLSKVFQPVLSTSEAVQGMEQRSAPLTVYGDNCNEAVMSENYIDLIVEYTGTIEELAEQYQPTCIQVVDDQFAILHIRTENCMQLISESGFGFKSRFPKPIGPYGKSELSEAGILPFHDHPYVPLRGQNILIGIVDSGIDYQHKVFTYEDNTTKIMSIWDQTIQGAPPQNFVFGTEYTEQQINQALQSPNPLEIVPSVDTDGHGTFLAGTAAGREDAQVDFIGAAPDADIIVVKLKQAKQCMRDYYFLNETTVPVYTSNDLMLGVKYLEQKSRELNRPLSIVVGLGSNETAHDGSSMAEAFLLNVAKRAGNVVTVAAGNEGNTSHHHYTFFDKNEPSKDIEVNVAPGEEGFILNIWANAPDKLSLAITSPTGEYIDKIPVRLQQSQEIKLVLESSLVQVEYQLFEERTGDELIIVRLERPTEGIWTFTLFGDLIVDGRVDAYLPRKDFIKEETVFLAPNPFMTVTFPSTSIGIMTTGAYNGLTGSLYLGSGRGLTRDLELKPDLVAPGVNVVGPIPGNQYGTMTGTSVSAAITAGAAALMLEWGINYGNDADMDTQKVINYLIAGASRTDNRVYPNREWGYGKLNVFGTFEALKGFRS